MDLRRRNACGHTTANMVVFRALPNSSISFPGYSHARRLLESYGTITREALLSCAAAPGLHRCFARLPRDARKIVVTGGMESEVREVFQLRGLASLFDAIYGSPDTKEAIVARGLEEGTIARPAIFIGDSKLDWEVSRQFGFDFIFLYSWSEVGNWESFCRDKDIPAIPSLSDVPAFLG